METATIILALATISSSTFFFYKFNNMNNRIKKLEKCCAEDRLGIVASPVEEDFKQLEAPKDENKEQINHKCAFCEQFNFIISCTVNEQGRHHSFNDEPSKVYSDGEKQWHKNGVLHRDNDLPAIIASNGSYWYKNGKPHRENGPAITYCGVADVWYIEGKELTKEEFINRTKKQTEIIGKVYSTSGNVIWYKEVSKRNIS